MRTLDLHGVSHKDAADAVRSFLNFVDMPCKIMSGNSNKMKEIVASVVKEYGYSSKFVDDYNFGVLVIYE